MIFNKRAFCGLENTIFVLKYESNNKKFLWKLKYKTCVTGGDTHHYTNKD